MKLDTVLHNRYKIISRLGSEESSNTYLAQDLDLPGQPQCIVKHLQPKSLTPSLLQAARVIFDRESKAFYNLGNTHNQIPSLFAHIEDNGQFYWVQAFINGHPLSQELVAGQAWSEVQVVQLLKEILEVLAIVHQHGIIHRDLKPQNLMRRRLDQKIVLINFGAVKAINDLVADATGNIASATVIGTAGYMPPEQAHGHPQFASDVYAVGVLGIQALLGRMPKQDANTGELIWKADAAVSPHLASVLAKMTCYHVQDRYASAQSALSALTEPVVSPSLEPAMEKPEQLRTLIEPIVSPLLVPAMEKSEPFSALTEPVVSPPLEPAMEKSGQAIIAQPRVAPAPKAKSPVGLYIFLGCLGLVATGFTAVIILLALIFSTSTPQSNVATTEVNKSEANKSETSTGTEPSYADAIKKTYEEIDQNLKDDNAYLERGLSRYKSGDYQGALKDYNKAISLNSSNVDAYNNRGVLHYKLGRYQDAINDYEQAIVYDPKEPSTRHNLGLARHKIGDDQGAIKDYTQAIRLDPSDASAYFNRAISREELNDHKGAIQDYDQTLRLDKNDADAYYNRAISRKQLNDKSGALKDFKKSADLYKSKGQTEYYQDAIKAIKRLEG